MGLILSDPEGRDNEALTGKNIYRSALISAVIVAMQYCVIK
jgi:hypothetical protein